MTTQNPVELDYDAAREKFEEFRDKRKKPKRYGVAVARALTAAHKRRTSVAERVDITTLERLHSAGAIIMPDIGRVGGLDSAALKFRVPHTDAIVWLSWCGRTMRWSAGGCA